MPLAQKPGAVKRGANLPPAGHARDEEMRRRTDRLAQQAEERAASEEVYAINPGALVVENELAQHFDELHVSGRLAEYEYVWENFAHQQGFAVRARLAIRVRLPGDNYMTAAWEVVQGDMPEARELLAVDGTRKLGDVLLMRCRKDIFRLIAKSRRSRAEAHTLAVDSRLLEMAEEVGEKYVRVHREMDENHPAMKHAAAASIAQQELMRRVRDGSVDPALDAA